MDTAGAVGSLVTFIFGIIASLYVARWLWMQGDRISGIERTEDGQSEGGTN